MADRRGELVLLDTHIWLWSILEPGRVISRFQEIISQDSNLIGVSAVSFWEIAMLVSKQRLHLPDHLEEWFENAIADSEIVVLPLTPAIVAEAYSLPGTFHDDPADRMIVATARNRDCLLLTEDSKILKYSHVRTA